MPRGKRTRAAEQKETRNRNDTRGELSEPLRNQTKMLEKMVIKNTQKIKVLNQVPMAVSYLQAGYIRARTAYLQHTRITSTKLGIQGKGHPEEGEGKVPISGPHQTGGEGSGGQGPCGQVQSMGGEGDRG